MSLKNASTHFPPPLLDSAICKPKHSPAGYNSTIFITFYLTMMKITHHSLLHITHYKTVAIRDAKREHERFNIPVSSHPSPACHATVKQE